MIHPLIYVASLAILALPVFATPTHVRRSRHAELGRRASCVANPPSSSTASSNPIPTSAMTSTTLGGLQAQALIAESQGPGHWQEYTTSTYIGMSFSQCQIRSPTSLQPILHRHRQYPPPRHWPRLHLPPHPTLIQSPPSSRPRQTTDSTSPSPSVWAVQLPPQYPAPHPRPAAQWSLAQPETAPSTSLRTSWSVSSRLTHNPTGKPT